MNNQFLKIVSTRKIESLANVAKIVEAIQSNKSDEFFFIPWIGRDYEKGLCGKKVLVMGAFHDCHHNNKCTKNEGGIDLTEDGGSKVECEHFLECTGGQSKKFNDECGWMTSDEYGGDKSSFIDLCQAIDEELPEKKELSKKLEATTLGEVCRFLDCDCCGNNSFKPFTKFNAEYFNIGEDTLWKSIAFANYAQNFQPKSGDNKFQSADFDAFKKYREILNPDVVIVWGKVGEELKKQGFKKNADHDGYIWKEGNRTYLHSYQPCYGPYKDAGKLKDAMNSVFDLKG